MRLRKGPFERVAQSVSFSFEGQKVGAFEGETIAAAIAALGEVELRQSKRGTPRGVFCGMGVCFECLVTVDGRHNVRSCMEKVHHGAIVERQCYPGGEAALRANPAGPAEVLEPDILIVGGGPAGLSAALAAKGGGLKVLVLDEREKAGGQYFKQPNAGLKAAQGDVLDGQYTEGAQLIAAVKASGAEILQGCLVWGAFAPLTLTILSEGRNLILRPRALIVATGAYERGVPTPGWTLPGFMTTGAAQTLLRTHRVCAGQRVVVAGNGPLNIQVAAELQDAGATVVAVVEAAQATRWSRILSLAGMCFSNPSLFWQGVRYLARLRRSGVPVLYGHAVTQAQGEGRVRSAIVAPLGPDGAPVVERARSFDTDLICVGYGFQPNDEIPKLLGAEMRIDQEMRRREFVVDEIYQTSIPGLYVVGDALGLKGSRVALAQGALAGAAALERLAGTKPREQWARKIRRQLHRNSRFQRHLWRLFQAPDLLTRLATDETIICRCEDVCLSDVRGQAENLASAGNVKRATRAGMGRCQGRYCGPVIERLVIEAGAYDFTPTVGFAPRPPIKPVLIADIASEPNG